MWTWRQRRWRTSSTISTGRTWTRWRRRASMVRWESTRFDKKLGIATSASPSRRKYRSTPTQAALTRSSSLLWKLTKLLFYVQYPAKNRYVCYTRLAACPSFFIIIIVIIDKRGLNARWCLTPFLLSLPTAAYLGQCGLTPAGLSHTTSFFERKYHVVSYLMTNQPKWSNMAGDAPWCSVPPKRVSRRSYTQYTLLTVHRVNKGCA